MSDTRPEPGEVWRYPFLWHRERARGEAAGRKGRPCAVPVVVRQEAGGDVVYFLPITSQPPLPGREALTVPETEARRAGLDTDRPLWVMLDEYNSDRVGASFHIEPGARIGRLGEPFLREIRARFASLVARRLARVVSRRG